MSNNRKSAKKNNFTIDRKSFIGAVAATGIAGCRSFLPEPCGGKRWYRGMLHMHSLWSDGRAMPEQAIAAYKDIGYDFVSLTDHNRFQDDPDRWVGVGDSGKEPWPPKRLQDACYSAYMKRFGKTAAVRQKEGKTELRLATYPELKTMFEEPGRFLLLPGVEITTNANKIKGSTRAMHMNVIGIPDVSEELAKSPLIKPLSEHTAASAIREFRKHSEDFARSHNIARPLCIVNHPHWVYYDIQAEDLVANPEIRFFEVCNNGTEWEVPEGMDGEWYNDKLWDVVNAHRFSRGQAPLYAVATDDTHFYPGTGIKYFAFGDGYVMVRASSLSQASLFDAMERGDFYASSHLQLEDVAFDRVSGTLSVSVPPMDGVACSIRFIVTKKGAPTGPVRHVDIPAEGPRAGRARSVAIYDDRIGATAKLVKGGKSERVCASYTLEDDDLYVRARIESDAQGVYGQKRKLHPYTCTAWTQPYGH
jgi:hypothetical protein